MSSNGTRLRTAGHDYSRPSWPGFQIFHSQKSRLKKNGLWENKIFILNLNPYFRTGKTTCLAEAIGQYHKQFPEKRILVIAPSHAAADNICLALGKYFRKSGQLYRMARVSKITDEKVLDYMPKLTSAESQNINSKVKRILDNSKSLVFSEEEYAIQEWIIFSNKGEL